MTREITEENRRRLAEWENEHKINNEMPDVTPEAIAERKEAKAKKDGGHATQWVIALLLLVGLLVCLFQCRVFGTGTPQKKVVWTCTEFDAPLEIVQLRGGKVDVYSGVDQPNTANVKGCAQGGSVGIEMQCQGKNGARYYRVRGVTDGKLWWGWVNEMDIE